MKYFGLYNTNTSKIEGYLEGEGKLLCLRRWDISENNEFNWTEIMEDYFREHKYFIFYHDTKNAVDINSTMCEECFFDQDFTIPISRHLIIARNF